MAIGGYEVREFLDKLVIPLLLRGEEWSKMSGNNFVREKTKKTKPKKLAKKGRQERSPMTSITLTTMPADWPQGYMFKFGEPGHRMLVTRPWPGDDAYWQLECQDCVDAAGRRALAAMTAQDLWGSMERGCLIGLPSLLAIGADMRPLYTSHWKLLTDIDCPCGISRSVCEYHQGE